MIAAGTFRASLPQVGSHDWSLVRVLELVRSLVPLFNAALDVLMLVLFLPFSWFAGSALCSGTLRFLFLSPPHLSYPWTRLFSDTESGQNTGAFVASRKRLTCSYEHWDSQQNLVDMRRNIETHQAQTQSLGYSCGLMMEKDQGIFSGRQS